MLLLRGEAEIVQAVYGHAMEGAITLCWRGVADASGIAAVKEKAWGCLRGAAVMDKHLRVLQWVAVTTRRHGASTASVSVAKKRHGSPLRGAAEGQVVSKSCSGLCF